MALRRLLAPLHDRARHKTLRDAWCAWKRPCEQPGSVGERANQLVASCDLAVAGEGAQDFLQNLVTADIDALKPGDATYSALLQPQGKILFDFFILAANGRYAIDCSKAQKADLLKRLTFYRLRAKVSLSDSDEEVGVAAAKPANGLSYTDPRAAQLGSRLIAGKGSLPEADPALGSSSLAARGRAHLPHLGLATADRLLVPDLRARSAQSGALRQPRAALVHRAASR